MFKKCRFKILIGLICNKIIKLINYQKNERMLKNKYLKLKKVFKSREIKLCTKDTINITFMVSISSMFPAKSLFEYLLKNSNKFNVKILIIPDLRFGIENAYKFHRKCYEELSAKYGKDNIILAPVNQSEDNIEIRKFTDILFCSLPYDVSYEKYALNNIIKLDLLPVMVNYGFFRSIYDRQLIANEQYAKYWKIFVETDYNLREFKKYSILNGENCILTGYCKMDSLKADFVQSNSHKTIIIAPHHSVEGGYNDILSLSNFYKYSDLFLKLPELYPDINWIFRPHPALFPLLEQDKFWGKEKVKNFIDKISSFNNVKYSDKGNYFEDFEMSDAIINDCGSYLVEYFYTGKPQCYMLKSESDIKNKFTKLGKECLKHCYIAYEENQIFDFINAVVLSGNDYKKTKRYKFARHKIMINYPNVSKKICKYLQKVFWGNK